MTVKTKREPIRQCAGCRERKPQAAMRRFVRTGPRDWQADDAKRVAGRGSYLCSAGCLRAAEKNRRFPGLAAAAAESGLLQG